MRIEPIVGAYEHRPAACQEHDPRSAEVARKVAALIEPHLAGAVVEHIGSTSVPGCAGKGVVDLMLVYPDGQLAAARDVLDALGFQRQTGRDPFPEDRPMRKGSLMHDGRAFNLHVHVIAASSPEVQQLRAFRDRLRADPNLVAAYVAAKRAIVADGCTDRLDYCNRKSLFVTEALRQTAAHTGGQHPADQHGPPEKVNLRAKLAQFADQWSPKIVGELNGQQVKLVKFQGPFVWHHHDHEDELFLVVKGRFRMEFRDRHVWLEEGEFLIVPRCVEHRPVAEEEVHVLLFEPASTLNTGNVRNERTVADLRRL
jgi:GrpB-like predicted nucleotidyltransferase (UPF0157 family)/mannose-6-phosphate isomerase-like protein (cupin superfamily)